MASGVVEGAVAQARRARLARHGAAQGVRRRRAQRRRALRGGRGAAAARRAARAPLDRRSSERPGHQPVRVGGAEAPLPPARVPRRAHVLDRHERARRGERPRVGRVPGDEGRRRLRAVGHEDLDQQRALRRLRHRAVPHERRRRSPRGLEPADRRPALARASPSTRSRSSTAPSDFNEVVFDGVFVPEDLLLGGEGQGWAQNTSELSFERAGPERWISPYLVVEHFLREYGDDLGVGRGALPRRLGRAVVGASGRCRSPSRA